MSLYSVQISQSSIRVGGFLRSPGLQPALPAGRIPALLRCGGVVLYTRAGTRSVLRSESDEAYRGDFLSVSDAAPTGGQTCTVAGVSPEDPAFVIPNDGYGANARVYMARRPGTYVAEGPTAFSTVLRSLISGEEVRSPIRDVLLVTHANEWSQLMIRLTAASPGAWTHYNALEDYVASPDRVQLDSRVLRSGANVMIRGCNIGRSQTFLRKVKELFGTSGTVSAPKHIDVFVERLPIEYLLYQFQVVSARRKPNKAQLVRAFRDGGFTDIDGNAIPDGSWGSWIPSSIHHNRTQRHRCTVPEYADRLIVQRLYKYKRQNYTFALTYRGTSPPAGNAARVADLRSAITQDPDMSPSRSFPLYEQFGFESADAFVDGHQWAFAWNASTSVMTCTGTMHLYQVRVPVVDPENTLLMNALPESGARSFLRQDILESDGRLFGTV